VHELSREILYELREGAIERGYRNRVRRKKAHQSRFFDVAPEAINLLKKSFKGLFKRKKKTEEPPAETKPAEPTKTEETTAPTATTPAAPVPEAAPAAAATEAKPVTEPTPAEVKPAEPAPAPEAPKVEEPKPAAAEGTIPQYLLHSLPSS
jgi:hypothetical protein